MWFCWPSRLFLDIILPELEQFGLSSNVNFSESNLEETEILWFQLPVESPSIISLRLLIKNLVMYRLTGYQNVKKRTHEGYPNKYSWLRRNMTYLSLDQGNSNFRRYQHWCLTPPPRVHDSNVFYVFKYWKHTWIYLDLYSYMLCHFIPLCIYIHKKMAAHLNPQIPCH